ncbi:MAG: hypothetical protein HY814_06125 [Candidatus Riflebacteria bacterium]|nr:hypothetical protein [Candidatus Riflebacteria bacterium]
MDAVATAYGLAFPWGHELSRRMGKTFRMVEVTEISGTNNYEWSDFGGKEILGSEAELEVPKPAAP